MTERRAISLASLLLLAAAGGARGQTGAEALAAFAGELAAVRSATSAEPVWAKALEPALLDGLSRGALLETLGAPDSCNRELTEACGGEAHWGYWFFYLPPGWRGGGPELWLEFDADDRIVEARWFISR